MTGEVVCPVGFILFYIPFMWFACIIRFVFRCVKTFKAHGPQKWSHDV